MNGQKKSFKKLCLQTMSDLNLEDIKRTIRQGFESFGNYKFLNRDKNRVVNIIHQDVFLLLDGEHLLVGHM